MIGPIAGAIVGSVRERRPIETADFPPLQPGGHRRRYPDRATPAVGRAPGESIVFWFALGLRYLPLLIPSAAWSGTFRIAGLLLAGVG